MQHVIAYDCISPRFFSVVGNECIKHFGGELSTLSTTVFRAFKAIKKDPNHRYKQANSRKNMMQLLRLAEIGDIIPKAQAVIYQRLYYSPTLNSNQKQDLMRWNQRMTMAFSHSSQECKSSNHRILAMPGRDGSPTFLCRKEGCPAGPKRCPGKTHLVFAAASQYKQGQLYWRCHWDKCPNNGRYIR